MTGGYSMSDEKLFVDAVGPAILFNGPIWIDRSTPQEAVVEWYRLPPERAQRASIRRSAARYTTRLKLRDWITGRRRPKGAERLVTRQGVFECLDAEICFHRHHSRNARSRRLNQSSTTARTVGGNQCDTQLSEHREANFRNHEIAGETVRGLRPRGQFRQFSNFRRHRLVRPANTPPPGWPPDELGPE